MKSKYILTTEYEVKGNPCEIGVTSYEYTPPFKGSSLFCYSDIDFYGEERIEYEVIDKSYEWCLDNISSSEDEQIHKKISKLMKEYYDKQTL